MCSQHACMYGTVPLKLINQQALSRRHGSRGMWWVLSGCCQGSIFHQLSAWRTAPTEALGMLLCGVCRMKLLRLTCSPRMSSWSTCRLQ